MIYVLLYETPPEGGLETVLQTHWPDRSYQLSDTVALVQEPNGNTQTSTSTIAEKAGITGENRQPGVVFRATFYSGFHHADLWEWLANAESNGG